MIPADILVVLFVLLTVAAAWAVLAGLGARIAAKRQRLVEPETGQPNTSSKVSDTGSVEPDELPTFLKRTSGDQAALRSQREGLGGKIL